MQSKLSGLLGKMLSEEAKKCRTDHGAILLLSIKSFLDGESQFEPSLELWQVADRLVRTRPNELNHTRPTESGLA